MSNVSEVVKKQLDDFRRELRLEIRTIKDSVKFSSDAADNVAEIMKDMKEMRLDMKKLVERNRELEIENQQLHQRVDELEQYQRLHNLEIKGLPSDCDETTVIKEIVNKLGETLDEQDIDVCHKVKIPHSAEKKRNCSVHSPLQTKCCFSESTQGQANHGIPWFRRNKQKNLHK